MPRIANAFAPRTQVGADLGGLVSALFPGPNVALDAEERRARIEERRMNAALHKAQMEKLAREATQAQEAQTRAASAPMAFVEGFAPGQGSDIMKFRQAGGMPTTEAVDVPPATPVDDEGYTMPMASLPRPSRYNAGLEGVIAPFLAALGAAGAGKSNVEQVEKASTGLGKAQAQQAVMGGADPTLIAQSYFATSGKAPFSDSQGRVLNVPRGTLNEGGAQATANVAKDRAQTNLYGTQAQSSVENRPLVPVFDPMKPTGYGYSTRAAAIGQAAPPPSVIAAATGGQTPPTKPLPPGALKMQMEGLEAMALASQIKADMGGLRAQVENGEIDLGPLSNPLARARNWAGMSNEQTRNFASFKSSLEKMRNQSLLLNKGTQTEGDANRAWSEIFENLNDPGVVMQRLGEIEAMNERAAQFHQASVDTIRSNYNAGPLDTSRFSTQPPVVGNGAAPRVNPIAPPPAAPARVIRYDANGNRVGP